MITWTFGFIFANNIELEIPNHISVPPLESTVLINIIYTAICYKINLQIYKLNRVLIYNLQS